MGLPTHSIPCCMQKVNKEINVDCLSPAGSDETVKPAASFPLSCCVRHSPPVESMKVLKVPETPPKYVGEPKRKPSNSRRLLGVDVNSSALTLSLIHILPISHYAARYGVDMDLLTRGAGFGYIGSTITSLIYASFTFIFFALEAAIMAYALELGFHIPPAWGYLICALVVIPLVTHGVTAISKLQTLTQPLWLILLILPFAFLLAEEPEVLRGLWAYPGVSGQGNEFNIQLFGAALTVGIALITQMGEQVDYLRFMPCLLYTSELDCAA